MQTIVTHLWFDNQAEEAAALYTALVPNSRVTGVSRYPDAMPEMAGKAMTVSFTLDGQEFLALNGGPAFRFTEAISLVIRCTTQAEIDHYWDALLEGGEAQMCGWLKDRYGLSWQIVPVALGELMQDPDPARVRRVTEAMLKMIKLDIGALEAA